MTHACEARAALSQLLDAIDNNVERRVLLSKRPGERRTESVVRMRELVPAYDRARAVLAR